jgi:ATP-binding cassette subfamily B protein
MHGTGLYEDELIGKAYDRRLMGRFVRYLAPYRWPALAVLCLLPLTAATKLGQPWLLKLAIDGHIITGDLAGLPTVATGYLGLILADSLLTYAQIWLLQHIGQRIMYDLRQDLFAHLQRLPMGFFDRTPTGGLVTRLTSDVESLGEMFAAGIITVVGDILVLAGIIGIMLWMNLKLSLVTFSVLPLLFWVAFTFRARMRSAYRQVRARLANLNTFLNEAIRGMAAIQLFNRQAVEREEFRRLNAEYRDANLPVITWDASLYALVETLSSVAVGLIIWYGGGEILAGGLTFGALVAFIQYIEKFFSPIRDLSSKYSVMQGAMASLERIFLLLDTETVPSDAPSPLPRPLGEGGATRQVKDDFIRFRDVWFAYDGDNHVLRGINLAIGRGETVALVGETGGGKTTVIRLLCRFYDINRGSISIDGSDIRHMPLQQLRRRIGVVLQDPFLFTGTVRANISLEDAAAAGRVEEAARTVGAHRFIERLPKGYDEEVREKGSNFSLGERQLISFARAVAFDPEILVLDEATASVDTESERLIQEGLQALMQGRTTLVVAHRLSTVRHADRIVVVHRGEKAEEGSHDELMARRGLYWRLHQLQFRE